MERSKGKNYSDLSCKISIAGFLCTIMVIYRHSLNFFAFFDDFNGKGVCTVIEKFCWMLTETAVPFFFLVSGFFFFTRDYYNSTEYKTMIYKKCRTLMLPYILLNLFWAVAYYFSTGKGEQISLSGIIENLYLSNFYGPLWYVRDLFVMMLAVPLYYWIFKIDKWYIYIALLIALFFFWNPFEMPVLNTVGLFMFPLGGILRRYSFVVTNEKNLHLALLFSLFWIILYSIPFWGYSFPYRYNLMMISGIIAFWKWLDYVPERINALLLKLAPFSFFLYVTHYYFEKVIKVTVGKMFFGNEIVALITYFTLPIIISICLIPVGIWLKSRVPRFYAIMTGGR